MRDQGRKYSTVIYDFKEFFPPNGTKVFIRWSDGIETNEIWENGVYNFNVNQVIVWPLYWSYDNE